MSQYKFYTLSMTLIILFGFLGVVELLSQTTTVSAAHGQLVELTGNEPTMTITSELASIAVHETTLLTVTLTDEMGEPISNTEVILTHTPNVTITNNLTTTNQNGILTGTFMAGTSTGVMTVTASLENQTLSDTVTITVTAGTPDKIMFINPPSLIKTNSMTVLTTTVQDAYGNLVSGEELSFTVTPFGAPPPTATTNANGVSTTTLTTSSTAGTLTVAASIANDPTISDSVTIEVELYQLYLPLIRKPLIPNIKLTASSTSIRADQSSIITAEVKDNDGHLLLGQEVSFESSLDGTIITPNMKKTDNNGIVTATLSVNSNSNITGIATITVKVLSVSNKIDIAISYYPTELSFTTQNWLYEGDQPIINFNGQSKIELGNSSESLCMNGLPYPGEWKITSQPERIPVPEGASTATVSIEFQGFTFDRNRPLNENYDFFKVLVTGDNSTEPLAQQLFANTEKEPGCNITPHSIGGPFEQRIQVNNQSQLTIELKVVNELDRYYNTWVEISNVKINWE